MEIQDRRSGLDEWRRTMVVLLRHQVALLAMKHGRAPLPISPALLKGLMRRGVGNDLYELGEIARRFSFLGDGRMLLAELKTRGATTSPLQETLSRELQIEAEDRP